VPQDDNRIGEPSPPNPLRGANIGFADILSLCAGEGEQMLAFDFIVAGVLTGTWAPQDDNLELTVD
jgi:hypothetical protein